MRQYMRVGSMGKRRGRRTRSDEGGRRVRLDHGVRLEWPGLSGPSVLTPEGRIQQDRAVSMNLARSRSPGAPLARVLWLLLRVPPAGLALGVVYFWRAIRRRPLQP